MTFSPRPLNAVTWASPQIAVSDVAAIAAMGVRRIVNNRPDGEAFDQPTGAEVAAAARAAGLDFIDAPVTGMPTDDAIGAVRSALEDGAPVLLYCRSGMRSAVVWAMAMRSLGRGEPDALRDAAAGAGYDLGRLAL